MAGPWEQFAQPAAAPEQQPQVAPQAQAGPWAQFAQAGPAQAAEQPKTPATASTAAPSSVLERIGSGIADPVWGGMQLAAHALPGVDSKIVDQMVKDREAEYNAGRQAGGSKGFDWARLVGNIANPINFATGGAAAGAGVAGRVAAGAAAGVGAGVLSPVTENTDNFGVEKAKQAGIGAATGGAVPVAGAAASRVIWPRVDAAVKMLMDKGITPTVGEILGGVAKTTEEKLASLPFVGDVIAYGKNRSLNGMNKALYNMALEPIGEQTTTKIGREAVKDVRDKLSNAYQTLLNGRTVNLDNDFTNSVADIWQKAAPLMSNDAKEQLKNILNEKVLKARTQSGDIDAELMKSLDTQLGQLGSRFRKTQDVNNQMIGESLGQVQTALRDAVGRSNPDIAEQLAKINEGYSVYARIRNAAARTGSHEGLVTPSTLDSAVRYLDNSVGKGGTATGTAPMRAFADAVRSTLGNEYKDSGTTGRMLLNLLLTGGAMHLNPLTLLFTGGATIAHLPGARKVAAAALAKRPDFAQPLAQGVEQAAQIAAPGVAMDVARR